MHATTFRALSLGVRLECHDVQLGHTLQALTATYARHAGAASWVYRFENVTATAQWTLSLNGACLYTSRHSVDLPPYFESELYRHALADRSEQQLALHAAALSDGERAVVLMGPSGVGKSTLAMALVARGMGYLTDEHAVVDGDGRVAGLTRPIGLDDVEGGPVAIPSSFSRFVYTVRARQGPRLSSLLLHPPADRLYHDSAPLAAIVDVSREPDRCVPDLQRLADGEAVRRLWVCAWARDPQAFHVAANVVRRCPVFHLRAGTVEQTCAAVQSLL